MAQAVRCSPPTAGVPSSCLGHSMWVSWWTKRGLGRFFTGFLQFFPSTNFIPPFLHTHLIHFISPCDGVSGVVGQHPCYSRTYNIGSSSHLIPRPDLVLDMSWGYLFMSISICPVKIRPNIRPGNIYSIISTTQKLIHSFCQTSTDNKGWGKKIYICMRHETPIKIQKQNTRFFWINWNYIFINFRRKHYFILFTKYFIFLLHTQYISNTQQIIKESF